MIKPIEILGLEHYLIDTNGILWSTMHRRWKTKLKHFRVRKHHPNKITGYHQVLLCSNIEGNKPKLFYVHRLVAEHFIPNPDNLAEVNHKDFDITNNSVDNLEWCSLIDNRKYKNNSIKKIGLILKDEKLLQEGIELYNKTQRISKLSKFWNIYRKAVNKILEMKNVPIRTTQKRKP